MKRTPIKIEVGFICKILFAISWFYKSKAMVDYWLSSMATENQSMSYDVAKVACRMPSL